MKREGLQLNATDRSEVTERSEFEDIIGHPHHVSERRIPMPMKNRAAQFAPFAALTGFDSDISEEARLTESIIEMTEDKACSLDEAFQKMLRLDRPDVIISYFKPDERKGGGSYEEYRGTFRFYDIENNLLKFTDGMMISAEMIYRIEFC